MKNQKIFEQVVKFHGACPIITEEGIEASFGSRLEAMIDTMRELSYRFPIQIEWSLTIHNRGKNNEQFIS